MARPRSGTNETRAPIDFASAGGSDPLALPPALSVPKGTSGDFRERRTGMRVVAMFRVSTERQANEGASLDAQQRTFREMAKRSGWKVVGEFRGSESATQAA